MAATQAAGVRSLYRALLRAVDGAGPVRAGERIARVNEVKELFRAGAVETDPDAVSELLHTAVYNLQRLDAGEMPPFPPRHTF